MQESNTLGRSRERSGRPTWPTSCDNMVSGILVARTPRTENALLKICRRRSPNALRGRAHLNQLIALLGWSRRGRGHSA